MRPAVEPAQEADEPAPAGDVPRELDGAFDRFGSALGEEAHDRLAHRIELVDPFAEAHLALVPVVRRDVDELVRGVLDGLDHLRMAVARAAHGDARREIQEAVAIHVPHFRAPAVIHDEG